MNLVQESSMKVGQTLSLGRVGPGEWAPLSGVTLSIFRDKEGFHLQEAIHYEDLVGQPRSSSKEQVRQEVSFQVGTAGGVAFFIRIEASINDLLQKNSFLEGVSKNLGKVILIINLRLVNKVLNCGSRRCSRAQTSGGREVCTMWVCQ